MDIRKGTIASNATVAFKPNYFSMLAVDPCDESDEVDSDACDDVVQYERSQLLMTEQQRQQQKKHAEQKICSITKLRKRGRKRKRFGVHQTGKHKKHKKRQVAATKISSTSDNVMLHLKRRKKNKLLVAGSADDRSREPALLTIKEKMLAAPGSGQRGEHNRKERVRRAFITKRVQDLWNVLIRNAPNRTLQQELTRFTPKRDKVRLIHSIHVVLGVLQTAIVTDRGDDYWNGLVSDANVHSRSLGHINTDPVVLRELEAFDQHSGSLQTVGFMTKCKQNKKRQPKAVG